MISILYAGNKLSRLGYTPGVIETLGPLLEAEGYRVFYAGTKKNQVLRLAEMLFRTLTRGRKANYILIDTYSTSAFWYAYLIGRLANMPGKKYIPILHGGDLPSRIKKSKRACDRLFLKSYVNVAVSGYLEHEFEKAGYKTAVIPNSIDITEYTFRLRDHTRPQLLWVRSFHRQYNPNMAADVLAELLKSYPDAELCMVGPDKDGSMKEFREYIRQKGIEDHVKITGRLSKEEWIRLSADYDFFINTTNVDNTPVSVIEAMALGMCVISTDPGGIPYLLNDGTDSFLVKSGDHKAMADKISQILSNHDLVASPSEAARHKAESFDWHQVRGKWTELLR
ncbi:MAG: glycosyltransferase family 4 protein [Bacteroidales bacterium]